jgi:type II secretory pathway component PulK
MKRFFPSFHNNRGVALLIVLLVTALLIALIFEFAYATRVSLRAAVNFRDSQRAYFLARSAVNVFAKYKDLQDNIPQGEWGVVPIVSEGDTELRIRWEDEMGKINITDVSTNQVTRERLGRLFELPGINVDVTIVDRMVVRVKEKGAFALITELHEIMSDEEFDKVKDYLTVYASNKINIYTASEVVLKSAGVSDSAIVSITEDGKNKAYKGTGDYQPAVTWPMDRLDRRSTLTPRSAATRGRLRQLSIEEALLRDIGESCEDRRS